ncbi:MAG: B12-binding domain-containing radical SAM protein [Candidatus Thorarchaeota archaeon]|jgi:anaerobic magnesium-protoporphyrin IX monomethyl ester cyclase
MTVDVLLVYPYFNEEIDTSVFRYPPLGLGYLASTLREAGISVGLIDGTFSKIEDVVKKIRETQPSILGIYSMITINHHARTIAKSVRDDIGLLVAGGPLPTLTPNEFLDLFDVVVIHEGEDTFLELARRFLSGETWEDVAGIAHNRSSTSKRPISKQSLHEILGEVSWSYCNKSDNNARMSISL